MAFNEALAARVRPLAMARKGMVEKKMFGGLAYLLNGNMSVGVHGDELIVRIAAEDTDAALREKGVRIFDITGKPMKGWLLVSATALKTDAGLQQWLNRGLDYAATLPKK